MKKFLENVGIVLSCIIVLTLMLTASLVFAQDTKSIEKKSYELDTPVDENYLEKNLELTTILNKKLETSKNSYEYELEIVDGNVISTSLNSGKKESIYSKGDAKYLTQINYYYYEATYILIVTESGELYANIYRNNQNKIKFRKIDTNNKIESFKVVERTQRFYEYPSVQLYGVNEAGDWELIRL